MSYEPEPGSPEVDELVSAVLDGEATDEERARVMADPVLRARLERFAAVAQAVGDVPGLDDLSASRTMAAAVAARGPAGPAGSVPSRRSDRAATWQLVAAVVAIVVLLPLGFLLGRATSDADLAATSSQDSASSPGASAEREETTSRSTQPDAASDAGSGAARDAGAAEPCGPFDGAVVARATTTYRGVPALLVVSSEGLEGQERLHLEVYSLPDCSLMIGTAGD